MEFEFNFGQTTLAQGVEKNDSIYASVSGVALSLSQDELVFMDKDNGNNHVMTHQVLQALSLCQEFKPLDQHVISINQTMPELANQVQAIQQVTSFLIDNKLLIEDKEWLTDLATGNQQLNIKSSGIVIRTSEKPTQLKRLLQSLVKYQKKHNTMFPIQVYDDSKTENQEKKFEELCNEYKADLSLNFYGNSWQTQFIKMLKTKFKKNKETIDWLLESKENIYTGGRVWNLALLNNAGKKFLFFDDDYIFETRINSKDSKKVDFNDKQDLSVGFSLNLTDIREASSEYDGDVLTKMLNGCGQTVGNWLSTTEIECSSLEGLNLIELQRINSNSVIKSIGNGTWGSPRSSSNYWLYFLEGEQKKEFWESRDVYLDNIEASNLMHFSENHEFLSLAKFIPSVIDNSTMSAFAAPTNHIEDHFFNAMSLYCYPNQVSLHYPFMLGHIKVGSKTKSNTNHIAKKPNFNQFIADIALSLIGLTDAESPKLRLKTLANYIMGLADSNDKNIFNRLKEYLSQNRSELVSTMQQQLANSPEAPIYWQADVRELIEANGKAILQNKPPVLGDWNEDLSNEECIDMARDELTLVANAMKLWPDLWEFCQTNK